MQILCPLGHQAKPSVLSPALLAAIPTWLSRTPRKELRRDVGMQQDIPNVQNPWDLSPCWLSWWLLVLGRAATGSFLQPAPSAQPAWPPHLGDYHILHPVLGSQCKTNWSKISGGHQGGQGWSIDPVTRDQRKGWLSLEKRWLWDSWQQPAHAYQNLWRWWSQALHRNGWWEDGKQWVQVKQETFRWDRRKILFTTRPTKCWSKLPRALVLLHAWGLPKPNWVKPSAIWADLRAAPALRTFVKHHHYQKWKWDGSSRTEIAR